jgi:hypothetical protein
VVFGNNVPTKGLRFARSTFVTVWLGGDILLGKEGYMDHSTATESRHHVEERLTAEVECTRAAYFAAKAEAERLQQCQVDLGTGQQYGTYALRKAINVQRLATVAFCEALVKFNRFILARSLTSNRQVGGPAFT